MTATLDIQGELERLREENETMNALLNERKRRIELSKMLNSIHPDRDAVVFKVGAAFEISHEEFIGKSRRERLVIPRQLAMTLMYELCDVSLAEVGKYFGGRDHGTVLHATRATKNRIDTDRRFAEQARFIRAQLAQKEGV